MKPKKSQSQLLHSWDIWNAVISALTEYDYPVENQVANEAYLVLQYYSEMESGGHESFLRWQSDVIEKIGIEQYLDNLTRILERIGAPEYARIEKQYGLELWKLYVALEKEEVDDEEFYSLIAEADGKYYDLSDQLEGVLEAYFVTIHRDLIDVIND
ncbi:DMP19 family protein [Ornithinibacillus halotolerans]|uniref:DNA mimic protein DMP19 C-terminal domain-containing protein n=1 Tax=Ornithinibacillus halotolerans TaxID=1274357 RepID=A0A916W989_9BACI|nr:hypothetical protein [Ornithinibacillus halotolerans]GGA78645.1 hypothetical protein GCM10008025_22680 [Ornithinibacillus halotolerans]